MLSFPFVMAGSASLPGIVTYCHCIPAPHSGTAYPPMRARPLCKYRVTARAPACSRQGPITPATAPSHRLVKIVRFSSSSFLLSLSLSLSSTSSSSSLFLSLCVFFIIPLYIPCSLFSFPFLCFFLSACWGSGRALHAVYSTDTYAIPVLFLIHLFPLILLVSAFLLYLYWSSSWVSSRTFSTTPSTPTNCGQYYNGWYWLLTSSALVYVLMDE